MHVCHCVLVCRRLNVKKRCSNFIMSVGLHKGGVCLTSCTNCSSRLCRFIFTYLESQCYINIVKLIFSSCKHPTLSCNKWMFPSTDVEKQLSSVSKGHMGKNKIQYFSSIQMNILHSKCSNFCGSSICFYKCLGV